MRSYHRVSGVFQKYASLTVETMKPAFIGVYCFIELASLQSPSGRKSPTNERDRMGLLKFLLMSCSFGSVSFVLMAVAIFNQ